MECDYATHEDIVSAPLHAPCLLASLLRWCRLRAKTEENRHTVDVRVKDMEAKLANQLGVVKALSEEADVLRLKLKNAVEATKVCPTVDCLETAYPFPALC